MREKIGKALKARATAIKQALTQYNTSAKALKPPRPELSWSKIVEMATLADFDLLRETRRDIREMLWTDPEHRRATNMYFNIKRAREEIARLNVEIPRLFTSMLDKHRDYYVQVARNMFVNTPLARELSYRWQYWDRVNARVVQHLFQVSKLPGFSGTLMAGKRVGRMPPLDPNIPLPSWACLDTVRETDEPDNVVDIPGVANEHEEEILVDYIDRLAETV